MTPKVSVIVPAYNAENTVREAVDSVLGQSLADVQVIVIDDGSTDGTKARIEDIVDPRIELHSFSNNGVCAARNRGLEKAKGDYIAFLDADDYWDSEKLMAQTKALDRNSEADVVYCQVQAVEKNGRYLFFYPAFLENGDIFKRILESNFIVSGSNLLMRKECIDSAGKYDSSIVCNGDWEYNIRLAKKHKFIALPDYLIYYRFESGTLSSNVRQLEHDMLGIIEKYHGSSNSGFACSDGNKAFVYRHLAFQCLFRTHDGKGRLQALRYLFKAAKEQPASIVRVEFLRLAFSWLFLMCFPEKQVVGIARGMLRNYGRLSKTGWPGVQTMPGGETALR